MVRIHTPSARATKRRCCAPHSTTKVSMEPPRRLKRLPESSTKRGFRAGSDTNSARHVETCCISETPSRRVLGACGSSWTSEGALSTSGGEDWRCVTRRCETSVCITITKKIPRTGRMSRISRADSDRTCSRHLRSGGSAIASSKEIRGIPARAQKDISAC